jgi:hypothetical protein
LKKYSIGFLEHIIKYLAAADNTSAKERQLRIDLSATKNKLAAAA